MERQCTVFEGDGERCRVADAGVDNDGQELQSARQEGEVAAITSHQTKQQQREDPAAEGRPTCEKTRCINKCIL